MNLNPPVSPPAISPTTFIGVVWSARDGGTGVAGLPGWEGPTGPTQMHQWTQQSLSPMGRRGLCCILPHSLLEWEQTPFQNNVATIKKLLVGVFPSSGFLFLFFKEKSKWAELFLFS